MAAALKYCKKIALGDSESARLLVAHAEQPPVLPQLNRAPEVLE
jgi:hypothetical protein